ncbi:MAG TPA: sorbosone dehydrogenase family protein [Candidatus Sulfotelmatobacter sp.]|jgi:glucose/arabinose dehydrogenase|nr:sorbosone dehydrogenase family protein [Candidatus Sulfotelmatobacter sp.]
MKTELILPTVALFTIVGFAYPLAAQTKQNPITGQDAFADWSQEKPGVLRKISVIDLPEPKPAESVRNQPHIVPRPQNAWPVAPPGFKVTLYAGGDNGPSPSPDQQHSQQHGTKPPDKGTFRQPRLIREAPNGDLFVADSGGGIIFVLRGITSDGKAAQIERFATGLDHPFGIAFYPADNPKFVYVANTTSVVRFAYQSGDLHASGGPQTIVPSLPGYAQLAGGGHWTRDVVFTKDGEHMLVSVGSGSNIDNPDDHPKEFHRANVLEFTPDGKFVKVFASGIRNCVGEAINPVTGMLWCSTNERDELGNHLVPDYVTSVPEDGFFGWPWYYMGGHQDPRLPQPCADGTGANPQATGESPDAKSCKHVDLHAKVRTPDVLVQPHMASLEMTFYPADGSFPQSYQGDGFAAEHGSWNREKRAGYEVIRIPMHNGKADGTYEDFLTGFVVNDDSVWGRPVGVAIGRDGSMFVTDDGSRSVWHVTYQGK